MTYTTPLCLSLCLALGCSSSTGGTAPDPASPSAPPEARNEYKLEGSGPELYEKILVPPLFAPWADDLISRAQLRQGQRVLDVATGTGIVARKAAAVVGPSGKVTALDINPAMLALAKTTDAPAEPAIEWVEGDAHKLPFPDKSFDVVFCQQAMQFFSDRPKAVREMYRVLVPGGRVAVASWRSPERNPYGIAFAKVVDKRVSPEAGAETRSPFGWDSQEEMQQMMEKAGFKNVKAEPITLDMNEADLRTFIINDLLAYPTTGKSMASWSDTEKGAVVDEIVAELAQYKKGDSWSIPWSSNVGIATK
jgi:ubiquinone/menaquinone biosynthesis C-methylase UbiE